MKLNGRVAIITGAGSGIGKATALLFAKEGAKVVVADMNEHGAFETAREIVGTGGNAFFFALDVTNREQIKQMVEEVLNAYGRVDILINNAGITQDAQIMKMTEEQWDKVIDVNLKGAFNCTQAVVEAMVKQGSGVILSTSSVVGIHGNFGQANYAASKAGLIGMTKTLAKELGKKGIRVNAIAPGFIATPMTAAVPEKVLEVMKEKTPLRKIGEPDDIAQAFLYLASDEAKFVTGTVLSVDGGLVL